MIDIEETKKILGKPKMSDGKAEQIRNEVQTLAEIVIDSYLQISPELREKLKK